MQRPARAWAAALALTLLLTGCAVSFTPDNATPTGDSTQATDAAPTPAAPAAPGDDAPAADQATTSALRDRYADDATRQSCDGALEVGDVGTVVRIAGRCDALLVSGTATVVIADSVGTLTVTASGVTVSVATVDAVELTADAVSADLEWLSGAPTVVDDGTANRARPAQKDAS